MKLAQLQVEIFIQVKTLSMIESKETEKKKKKTSKLKREYCVVYQTEP